LEMHTGSMAEWPSGLCSSLTPTPALRNDMQARVAIWRCWLAAAHLGEANSWQIGSRTSNPLQYQRGWRGVGLPTARLTGAQTCAHAGGARKAAWRERSETAADGHLGTSLAPAGHYASNHGAFRSIEHARINFVAKRFEQAQQSDRRTGWGPRPPPRTPCWVAWRRGRTWNVRRRSSRSRTRSSSQASPAPQRARPLRELRPPRSRENGGPLPPFIPAGCDTDALCDGISALLLSEEWESKLGALLAAKVRSSEHARSCGGSRSARTSAQQQACRSSGDAGRPPQPPLRQSRASSPRRAACTRRRGARAPPPTPPPQLLAERAPALPAGFDAAAQSEALRLLEDGEVRVRLATGQLLGALAWRRGPAVFAECRERVLRSILEHYVSQEGGRGRMLQRWGWG
jgi:hypothetical protein